MKLSHWAALGLAPTFVAATAAPAVPPVTVADLRSLPTPELAAELLGQRMGSRVIEAKRYEYAGPSGSVPQYVEFFTQPELSMPVINGICRTDVITVEYNWFDHEAVNDSTSLKIARVAAKSKYKSFADITGDPSFDEQNRAQYAACANMKTALNAFRAPSAGDAQWLAAIHREYSTSAGRFKFSCKDFADRSCASAREVLRSLALDEAENVERIDCPKTSTPDQVSYCYRLTYAYPEPSRFPEIGDYTDVAGPEWILTVFAGMRDGAAPVKIRSLHLEHVPPPLVLH